MRLLALDTSGEACSAALLTDRGLEQRLEQVPRGHGERILGLIQSLLDDAGLRLTDLDALACGCGPGSFTGVRIAVSVVQGLAFGAGLPTVPVSTLAGLAQGQFRRGGQKRLLAALDARMDEVYWGAFLVDDRGLARPHGPELVALPATVPVPDGAGWQGVGPGWTAHGAALRERLGAGLDAADPVPCCEARDLAVLAAADFAAGVRVAPEALAPVYLRDRVTRV